MGQGLVTGLINENGVYVLAGLMYVDNYRLRAAPFE